ncbi:MAG: 50S ribosomal protein L21 [Candidatus Cloacimonetes bacterium]|nr:50S ribosomal protein L21 [Candidatus Cloacimonadota bacterium]MBL7107933.1 50S ribosomal protein L21 [Candidatus Cloacimonadota bacterium]
MYAIVELKGQQVKVQKNEVLKVPFLEEHEIGKEFEIKNVLLVKVSKVPKIGKPKVKNAKVIAEVLSHGKDKKIIVFKKKRRKGYKRKQGHRQQFTEIKITDIKG